MAYIDPIESSPDVYRVLLDNEHVRVLEMKVRPGETDEMHSHSIETTYFTKGGRMRIHLVGAKHLELDVPDGHVMRHKPWTHRVENTGKIEIRAIIFEAKRDLGF